MRHLEHAEQVSLCRWMDMQRIRYFAIPNGGARDVVTGARLKAEGVKPGVPDLFIPALRMFIELKRREGATLTTEQRAWIAYLKAQNYRVEVCKGWDEARTAILKAQAEEADVTSIIGG